MLEQKAPTEIHYPEFQGYGRSMIVALVVLMIAAYMTMFLDAYTGEGTTEYSPLAVVFLICSGVVYYVAISNPEWFWDRLSTPLGDIAYFTFLYLLIFVIGIVGEGEGQWWLLYLPAVGQSAEYGRRATVIICTSAILLISAVYWIVFGELNLLWTVPLYVSPAVLFVAIFMRIAALERNSRLEVERLAGELQAANHKLSEYANKVEELAIIRERNRLAREIHDSLGHYLTVVNVQIGAAQAILPHNVDKAREAMVTAQKMTQEGLREVRQSVAMLREERAARPLLETLPELVSTSNTAGIDTQFELIGQERSLSPTISRTIYRLVQEGLTNVRKHADASNAWVKLDFSEFDTVSIEVGDNGCGAAAEPHGGFGLLGIRERVSLAGGELQIVTSPGAGLRLRARLPVGDE